MRLSRNLFIREAWNVCTLARVLNRDAADIAALVEIQNSVLIQIFRFGYFGDPELDRERVGVLEILNLHLFCLSTQSVRPVIRLSTRMHNRQYENVLVF